MNPQTKAARLLEQIKAADAAQWSQPSNYGALRVHDMEREYQNLTGQPCPDWPHRDPRKESSK